MKKHKLLFLMTILFLVGSCKDDHEITGPDLPELRICATSVVEGNVNTVAECQITLSNPASENIIIRYSTKDGTAKAGADYIEETDGMVLIPAGYQESTISITIIGDRILEQTEHFEVIINSALNAKVLTKSATVEIRNNPESYTFVIPESGFRSPMTYDGYELVWADEFNDSEINKNNWTVSEGSMDDFSYYLGYNNQYYRKVNVSIHDNAHLVVTTKKKEEGENTSNRPYTSGEISGKKFFKFGRIDIRALLPVGKGIWPSLKLLSNNGSEYELIYIMKSSGHEADRIFGMALSSGTPILTSSTISGNEGNFNQAFHVFSLIWEEDKIQWLVDDKLFYTITQEDMAGQPYPFTNPAYFSFQLKAGADHYFDYPEWPDSSTIFPQHFIVDYIRVFQK